MSRIIGLILLLLLINPLNLAAQDVTSSDLPGYIVYPMDTLLQFETLTNGSRGPLSTLQTENSAIQYLALSPNEQLVALIGLNLEGGFSLEIYDLRLGIIDHQKLPVTTNLDVGYSLTWSPDSSKLVVNPSSLLEKHQIYDVKSRILTPIPTDFVIGLQWLPDNNQFVFNGAAVCGLPCKADTDIYLGEYKAGVITVEAITRLDASTVGLVERMTSPRIGLSFPAYQPKQNRFYARLTEIGENPKGFVLLASFDLEGTVQLEADISALYPDTSISPRVSRIFTAESNDHIYLVTEIDDFGEDQSYRWNILRYNISDRTIDVIYQHDFPRGDTVRLIHTTKLSRDGRYLALGGTDNTRARAGNLIIVDLQTSSVILEQNNLLPVCELFWSDDNTHVIYTQTDDSACVRYYDNLPVNRLVEYNVESKSTQVLVEDKTTPFYFLSGQ